MIPFVFASRKKTCPVCEDKYPKTERFHELRLNTMDGITTLEICEKCADFFEKSAGILQGERKDEPL